MPDSAGLAIMFAAPDAAEYLPKRQRVMQYWADYLDALKAGADVVPINKSKTAAR
jgi:hypothetical protein